MAIGWGGRQPMAIAIAIANGNQQPVQAKKKVITCSSETGELAMNDFKILAAEFKIAIKPATQLPESSVDKLDTDRALLATSQVQAFDNTFSS